MHINCGQAILDLKGESVELLDLFPNVLRDLMQLCGARGEHISGVIYQEGLGIDAALGCLLGRLMTRAPTQFKREEPLVEQVPELQPEVQHSTIVACISTLPPLLVDGVAVGVAQHITSGLDTEKIDDGPELRSRHRLLAWEGR